MRHFNLLLMLKNFVMKLKNNLRNKFNDLLDKFQVRAQYPKWLQDKFQVLNKYLKWLLSKVQVPNRYLLLFNKLANKIRITYRSHKKMVIALAVVGGIYVVIKSFVYFYGFLKPAQEFAIPVEVAKVRVGPAMDNISTIGHLIGEQAVILRNELPGRILEIPFTEGTMVNENDVLVVLDHTIQDAALAETKANLDLSKVEYDRIETLLKKNAVSISERDKALAKLKITEALSQSAQATLSKMTIRAPFSGLIGIIDHDIGAFLNMGENLVSLVKTNPILVEFRIPEIYFQKIYMGQEFNIASNAFQNQIISGKIRAIEPAINLKTHSVKIQGIVDNTNNTLKPGLFVTVNLILEKKDHAMLIPESALMPLGGKVFVYVVKNNIVEKVEVETGIRMNSEVEILSGINAGSVVVIGGQLKIQPNFKVTPIFAAPTPPGNIS